jgi:hypothetical protein
MEALAGLLGGGGGAAPPPMTAGAPLEAPAPAAGEVDVLKQMIELAGTYQAIPTVDESERLDIEKVRTILQQLLAGNEKMADSLTGADPALRKALGPVG